MITLQNLKDLIEAIENDIPHYKTLEDIPLQFDYTTDIKEIELDLVTYFDFEFCKVTIK